MAVPRILVIIVIDGKEMVKKPLRAGTFQEVIAESQLLCPEILTLQLERVQVYDKGFQDFIDDDEHILAENDKICLHFTTTFEVAPSDTASSTGSLSAWAVKSNPGRTSSSPSTSRETLHTPAENASTATGGEGTHMSSTGNTKGQSTLAFVGGKLKISREAPANTQQSTSEFTEDELEEKAKIYGRNGNKLNAYQKRVNSAAANLVKLDSTLLLNRGILLEKARSHVHESGYEYAHGKKTRSKAFGQGKQAKSTHYITASAREDRLETINEQITSLETQILFLDKGKDKAATSGQFGQAVSFEQQSVELKLKLRKLKFEKNEIKNKTQVLESRRFRRKSNEKRKHVRGTATKKRKEIHDQTSDKDEELFGEKESNGEESEEEVVERIDPDSPGIVELDGEPWVEDTCTSNTNQQETAEALLQTICHGHAASVDIEIRAADSSADEGDTEAEEAGQSCETAAKKRKVIHDQTSDKDKELFGEKESNGEESEEEVVERIDPDSPGIVELDGEPWVEDTCTSNTNQQETAEALLQTICHGHAASVDIEIRAADSSADEGDTEAEEAGQSCESQL